MAGWISTQPARKLLPNQLQLSKSAVVYTTSAPGSPYTITVRVENPSAQAIDWEAGLLGAPAWVQLGGVNANNLITDTASYGQPGHFTLVIADQNAAPGQYSATAQVVGTAQTLPRS